MKTTLTTSLLAWALTATAQTSPSCSADHDKIVTITANNQEYTYHVYCGLNTIGPDLARYSSTGFADCAQDCANNGTACVGATYIEVTSTCVQKSEITEPLAYAASANAQSVVLIQ